MDYVAITPEQIYYKISVLIPAPSDPPDYFLDRRRPWYLTRGISVKFSSHSTACLVIIDVKIYICIQHLNNQIAHWQSKKGSPFLETITRKE